MRILLSALACLFLPQCSAFAHGCEDCFLPESGADAPPPSGYIAYCARLPGECAAPGDGGVVVLNPEIWALIGRVNRAVNTEIAPMRDVTHYKMAEYWTIPADGYGDCEDYTLTKRQRLIAQGLPAGALRIGVVKNRMGAHHAVLTLASDRGDYVLDNETHDIMLWNLTSYYWIARQSARSASGWIRLHVQG